jgi:hypothetical protein
MIIYKCDICGNTEKSKYAVCYPTGWDVKDKTKHEGLLCPFCVDRRKKILEEERLNYETAISQRLKALENDS